MVSYIPSVTNFVAINIGSEENSKWLFDGLLDEGVIVRPLLANGMPNFVRVSLGVEKEMEHFYEAMNKLLPALMEKMKTIKVAN